MLHQGSSCLVERGFCEVGNSPQLQLHCPQFSFFYIVNLHTDALDNRAAKRRARNTSFVLCCSCCDSPRTPSSLDISGYSSRSFGSTGDFRSSKHYSMKRQWWEISAGPEPTLAYQLLLQCPSPLLCPTTHQSYCPEAPAPWNPSLGSEATKMSPIGPTNPRSPGTPLDSPIPSLAIESTRPSEEDECLDLATRMCLSRALKVEPKYVCCEAFAYSVLCKHSRGVLILPSQIAELWDLLPNSFKYTEGEGKYTVLGANPRKHDAVTCPTDALPHTVRLAALYVRQTHPHF